MTRLTVATFEATFPRKLVRHVQFADVLSGITLELKNQRTRVNHLTSPTSNYSTTLPPPSD